MNLNLTARTLAIFCLVFFLVACGGAKEQFFRLSAEGSAHFAASTNSIGVGPVSLPGYLDRAELVFQNGENEFQVPSNVRWTGSLQENISRVLAADLGPNVVSYPWPARAAPAFQIAIDIRQFHAISGSEAILDVTWRIENRAGAQTIARQSGNFREPIVGDGYAAVVAAESRLLEKCAAVIARSLPRR